MTRIFTLFLVLISFSALATVHQVTVGNDFFSPKHLDVLVGDTVVWTNSSGMHNVNGSTTTFPSNPVSFGNGIPASNWTYTFVFSTAGLYNYQCDPHIPQMVGTIRVLVPCSDLFFSEYLEGSSNNKAIEIYNPTNAAINLSTYIVRLYSNGSTAATNTLNLPNKTIPSKGTYVIANSAAIAAILSVADTTSTVTFFNGDDALVLFKGTDTLDIIGKVGEDPGTSWVVGTGSTLDFTLVRKSSIVKGQRNWLVGASEWDVYPVNTTTFLDNHSSVCGTVTPPPPTGIPTYSISQINGVNANGVLDSLNLTCYIRGYVSGGNLRTSGVEFWFIDSLNSAGTLVRSTTLSTYTVNQGDKLRVRGTVSQFNGLFQFVPDSIWVLSTGNALPAPASTFTLNESTEGRLIVMNNMTVVSGWPAAGASANVTVTDGTNNFTLRINNLTTFISDSIQPAPSGLINIIGHGSQFDNSNPFTSGYQIQPRSKNDIVPVVVTNPTVNFPSGAQTVSEGVGTVTINMPVAPSAAAAQTVKIHVSNGAGVTSADYATSPAAVNDTITLSVPAGANASFTITVTDDQITENNEVITFTIASVSSGLNIGPVNTHLFTIADNDVFIPTYAISQLKGLNASFLPDSLGVMCKIVGTVLGVDMQGTASTSVSFTVHDGTVGFGVFMPNSTYTVNEGDQVRVIGVVGHFNGLAQINADSIVLISTGNPLPTPVVITQMGESTESQLIRFNNATIVNPAQWTNAGSGFNVDITDGVNTIVLRIDADVNLYSMPAPVGTFDVIGIGGQFDNSAPHNSGYQFLPRYSADIIYPFVPEYKLAITEVMSGSNLPNTNASPDWWELTNYGSDPINLEGFSWDDDRELPGAITFPNITILPGESFVIFRGNSANEPLLDSIWGLGGKVTIISANEMNGTYPNLNQSGDKVVLYDTSAVPVEICKVQFVNALSGVSVEFDTNCVIIGNAQNGLRGAYTSIGGDIGSPGNVTAVFSVIDCNFLTFAIYPNPAQNSLHLNLPEGEKHITLTSVTGVHVYQTISSESQIQIDLKAIPAGIYLVQVEMNNQRSVQKLIKQ
jgi:predicted extracellular nuclease/plastocyanin